VQAALTAMASRLSSRTVQIAHNMLVREQLAVLVWRADRAGGDTLMAT
jgi:hypothetical protein